jgi:hypothetical protein
MIGSFSSYSVRKIVPHLVPLASDDSTIVYATFFVETLDISLSGAGLYYWFVSGYGDINHLTKPYLGSFDVLMLGPMVSLSVQFFFVYRIWILGEKTSWFLCLIICLVG